MKTKGTLQNIPSWQKFLLAVFLVIMAFVVSVILMAPTKMIIEDESWLLRTGQLYTSVFVFIVTPMLYNHFTSQKSILERVGFDNKPNKKAVMFTILSILFISAIIGSLAKLNQSIQFPEWLEESIKAMEDDAAKLTIQIIATSNPLTILFNLILIGLIPAIGEELMFRVLIQNKLQRTMAIWLAIIVTSIIFSAMHFQFYGFIPRFALSVWLGILYFWGRSTWLNSIAHFTNNVMGVGSYYIYKLATGEWPSVSEMESMDAGEDLGIVSYIVMSGLFALCVFMIYKNTRANEGTNINKETQQTETCD